MSSTALKTQGINSMELEGLLAMKKQLKTLQGKMERIQEAIKCKEADLINLVDGGAASPAGFTLSIREFEKRYPAWKEHYISLTSQEQAEAILKQTEPTLYRNLVIKKVA